MSTRISVDEAIRIGEAEAERRASEFFLRDGDKESVSVDLGVKQVETRTMKGYKQFGVSIRHNDVDKTFWLFPQQMAECFKAAKRNGDGRITVERHGDITTFS